jgi:hypothetical protein
MEEEKRRELRHILISYIPYGDLEYEVKDYENIINFIANYFKEKDYQYVIGRDTVINQKLKDNSIPISVIQNKIIEERKYHEKNISDIENITMFVNKTPKEQTEIEFNKYAIVVLNRLYQKITEERNK